MSVPSAEPGTQALDTPQLERLDIALRGLTRAELQWASGYAAGLAANGALPAIEPTIDDAISSSRSTSTSTAANTLTILFGSQTGNGESVARDLKAKAVENGFAVRLESLADYKPASLKRESLLAFVISTHGDGDPPDDAELFHEFLLSEKAPPLTDLEFTVLALGDSSYVNFCETGREVDRRLAELGARRLMPIVECDIDYESDASSWVSDVLKRLPELVDTESVVRPLRAVESSVLYGKERPFAAEVLVNQKITSGNSSKDVRHIELSLEGSGLHYKPGDSLAVVAENPPALVQQVLSELALDADASVRLHGEDVSLDEALSRRLEITVVNLGFLKHWSDISGSDELEALLGEKATLGEFVETHQIIDTLRRFPARPSAQEFVDSLRKLTPRSYSISSSETVNPDEVHITVAAVRYGAFGSQHWGAASTHLADRTQEGDVLEVYVEPNSRFRLPDDDTTDIVMIGPGTGVAPFRAFVEERLARNAAGKNWLIFGERNFSSDFLYQIEWQRHLKNGALSRLDVAFSRDQPEKIYVQDRIRENGGELARWLRRGAQVYVCGDAKQMAADVDSALIDVLVAEENLSRDDAANELKVLRRAGRYQRDVY